MSAIRWVSLGIRAASGPPRGTVTASSLLAVFKFVVWFWGIVALLALGGALLRQPLWVAVAVIGAIGGFVALVATMRRRGRKRRWLQQRPHLAQQWRTFVDHCNANGTVAVQVGHPDNYDSGAMAWITPIEVGGVPVHDSWFPGLRLDAERWYSVVADISYSKGFRSEVFLWVSSVTDGVPSSALRAWSEEEAI